MKCKKKHARQAFVANTLSIHMVRGQRLASARDPELL